MIGEVDVADLRFLSQIEQFRRYGASGESLKRERGDKFHGVPGHNNRDSKTILNQESNQLYGFVARDSAADS